MFLLLPILPLLSRKRKTQICFFLYSIFISDHYCRFDFSTRYIINLKKLMANLYIIYHNLWYGSFNNINFNQFNAPQYNHKIAFWMKKEIQRRNFTCISYTSSSSSSSLFLLYDGFSGILSLNVHEKCRKRNSTKIYTKLKRKYNNNTKWNSLKEISSEQFVYELKERQVSLYIFFSRYLARKN